MYNSGKLIIRFYTLYIIIILLRNQIDETTHEFYRIEISVCVFFHLFIHANRKPPAYVTRRVTFGPNAQMTLLS